MGNRTAKLPQSRKYVVELVGEGDYFELLRPALALAFPNLSQQEVEMLAFGLFNSLQPATRSQYMGYFCRFAKYCLGHEPVFQVLPATRESVLGFLASLAYEGSLHPSTFNHVVSAVNTIHSLCGFAKPLQYGPNGEKLVQALSKGLGKLFVKEGPGAKKVPLLAEWVVQVLDFGLASKNMVEVRNATAAVVGFLVGFRGSSVAAMMVGDLKVAGQSLLVNSQHFKTAVGKVVPDWVVPLSTRGVLHKVGKLVMKWLAIRIAFKPKGPHKDLLWVVHSEPKALTEPDVDVWVQSAVAKAGVSVEGLSSHSLRVGCVSGLYALGAEVHFICIWMRWTSDAMVNTYVHVVSQTDALKSLLGKVVAARATARGS
jgi:site-specific recombinase XerD